uniref:protein-serine/threonine phosphatase n=1 Tax=Bionectria ochroleuca TaxID=29856 RepID=A0A0B7JTD9_BIOOC
MAASNPEPKSILKKPGGSRPTTEQDRRAIAIQHAQIIEHRKELEAQILDDVILLSEYPRAPGATSSDDPAPSDVVDFKTHVRLFQPSDYDDLIEERNVNGLCGDLEKWCSQKCARRALYVKVQLNETAAWERAGIPDIEIEIMDLPTVEPETEEERTAKRLGELTLEDQRQAARDSAALALERGELPTTATPTGVARKTPVKVTLKENTEIKEPPSTGVFEDDDHLMVEGYKSTRGTE